MCKSPIRSSHVVSIHFCHIWNNNIAAWIWASQVSVCIYGRVCQSSVLVLRHVCTPALKEDVGGKIYQNHLTTHDGLSGLDHL